MKTDAYDVFIFDARSKECLELAEYIRSENLVSSILFLNAQRNGDLTLVAEIVVELIAILVYFVSPFRKKSSKSVVEKYVVQLDKFKRVISEIVSGIEEQ